MSDSKLDEAIDIVARKAIDDCLVWAAEFHLEWADLPDLGEFDFGAVVERVQEIAKRFAPDDARFDEAYQYLANRAGEND